MIKMDDIFIQIVKEFDQLWNFKYRDDNTLEVLTPYSTTTNKFVSLFVVVQNGKYVITDGGLLNLESYDTSIDYDNECLLKILYHLESYYEVKTTEAAGGTKHYYRTTEDAKLIPNLIYDMAQFVSMCASAASVQFVDEKEKEAKETFRKMANSYLESIVDVERIQRNASLNKEQMRTVRFNAIVTHNSSSMSLINYLSGSSPQYFTNTINRAYANFKIAENSAFSNHIVNKVAIIDNTADGYQEQHLFKHLELLKEQTGNNSILWSERERLNVLLN